MPRATPKKAAARIFQLKIALEEVEPSIWRRLLVPSDITLAKLHFVLQKAMGWTNSHLHQFVIFDRHIGDLRQDEGELGFEDERKVKLDHLVGVNQSVVYEYDFGDGWTHDVKVEQALEVDNHFRYPACTAGARACPPEDVGGPPGYETLIAALSDSKHEEHDGMVEWVGGVFDPEGFDVNAVNRALRSLR